MTEAGGSMIEGVTPLGAPAPSGEARPGEPMLRWTSRASTIDGIERELAKIWTLPNLTTRVDGQEARHIAARTSVMNLVVIARRPEIAERCSAIISLLTGRHPSRTIILSPADPDGPGWLDARVTAHCILPREDAPETCAEMIFLSAGGETGRHLDAIVEPLIVHDLPVTLWWPGEPPLESRQAVDLFESADRLVVDGSSWTGDGLARMGELARVVAAGRVAVFDFALIRQSRWREAIASTFDMPEFLPFLAGVRRVAVTYGTHDELGRPGTTNMVKPLYHVSWIASRLAMTVARPLAPIDGHARAVAVGSRTDQAARRAPVPQTGRRAWAKPVIGRGYGATLRQGRGDVAVVLRPVLSPTPSGTTLRVELLAERRGSELRVDVTAEAETVTVRAWQDGVELLERRFLAPRRTEADLLTAAIESPGRDPIAADTIRMAAHVAGTERPAEPPAGGP